jgi:K+-sensing histidine kinase KdpD
MPCLLCAKRTVRPACFIAMLGYNSFLLPPIFSLTIQASQNRVALVAFSIAALVTGQLSASARRRATEAERSKPEAERFYRELQASLFVFRIPVRKE